MQPRTLAKNCPECGQPLTARTNRAADDDLLDCGARPGCKHTEPMPLDMMLRRQDHPELPGVPGQTGVDAPGSGFKALRHGL